MVHYHAGLGDWPETGHPGSQDLPRGLGSLGAAEAELEESELAGWGSGWRWMVWGSLGGPVESPELGLPRQDEGSEVYSVLQPHWKVRVEVVKPGVSLQIPQLARRRTQDGTWGLGTEPGWAC